MGNTNTSAGQRIALLVEYNGRRFCGSQYQAGVRTVQAELESALSTYLRQPIGAIFAGRTDTGVHAEGQVVHFDSQDSDIDLWQLSWALNGILADDLCVVAAQKVPGTFHARFSATRRKYVYRILNRPQRSAILRDTHHFLPRPLDVEKMTEAIACLIGDHDFASFKSTNSDQITSQCQVFMTQLFKISEGQLEFWIEANHFVYNMVRIIVGTLIDIGLGKKSPESLDLALQGRDRNLAGPTAPPWGLCLKSVSYPKEFQLFSPETSLVKPLGEIEKRSKDILS